MSQPPPSFDPNNPINQPVISKGKLRELGHLACPGERFDPVIEGVLVKIAEDFAAKAAQSSSELAKHRKSKILEPEDVQLHLERVWDLGIPGFASLESRPGTKSTAVLLGPVQKDLPKPQ